MIETHDRVTTMSCSGARFDPLGLSLWTINPHACLGRNDPGANTLRQDLKQLCARKTVGGSALM